MSEIWGVYIREGLLLEGFLCLRFGVLYSGGLIIGRIFASEIWGVYIREGLLLEGFLRLRFGGAYFREGLLSEGYLRLRFGGFIFGRAYYWKDFCV